MFLHVMTGLWFGRKGIITILVFGILTVFGLGWLWHFKTSDAAERRHNVLVFGTEYPRRNKNLWHDMGDMWEWLRRVWKRL